MINVQDEVVASRRDAKSRMNYYTIERAGRRWTVGIADADLNQYKGPSHLQARQNHLANALEAAMRGKADGEA